MALPAVDVSQNSIAPPPWAVGFTGPTLYVMLGPPADAAPENLICACVNFSAVAATTICCEAVPAFEHPAPDMVSAGVLGSESVKVSVYAGAWAENTICCTVAVLPLNVMLALLVAPRVAVPVGTDAGLQFAAVFQSVEAGCADHVAFPPAAVGFVLADIGGQTSGCERTRGDGERCNLHYDTERTFWSAGTMDSALAPLSPKQMHEDRKRADAPRSVNAQWDLPGGAGDRSINHVANRLGIASAAKQLAIYPAHRVSGELLERRRARRRER